MSARLRRLGVAALFVAVSTAATADAAESQPRRDVTDMVMIMDGPRDKNCAQRKVAKIEVLETRPDGAPTVERWTLDRCGKLVNHRIRFTANPKGGTNLDVQLEK